MPTKQQLDKQAWEWASTVDPRNITQDNIECAYRLKLKRCKIGCRRNCRGNPYCLSNLGEKTWMQDIADDEWHEVDDQNSERRVQNTFVGLKNLGATCYVNSFLQVWFHNPTFRRAIYSWKPLEDLQERDQFSEEGSFKPVSLVGHLQMLFAYLQFSARRYIDPSNFISVLGLNTTMQQDAQEFRQLFISLLERKLSHQHNPFVKNIIHTQYSGENCYVTRCHNCSIESTSSSTFYDLDLNIKGHKELSECLDEFLQDEHLDGPNQYFCGICNSKQNATRFIRLVRLPPVLHLQLLRFYFDRQAKIRKKLNSFIGFPEVLDMSKYMNRPNNIPENSIVYELTGVLIHRGPSACSGHYIAHIKDRMTGNWFKFNDENVAKIEGKKLELGSEEGADEESTSKPALRLKSGKGIYTTNNAYMLVYKLRSPLNKEEEVADSNLIKWDVPTYLQQAILEDNTTFEEWVRELDDQRAQNVATGKAKQMEIRSLYEKLPFLEDEEFEWVPTKWLTKWLSSDTGTVPSVSNAPYLCQHGKLNPDDTGKLKCISRVAADEIFQKYGGGPRIRDGLCRKCVESRCQIIRIKNKVMDDHKLITNMLKRIPPEIEEAFWLGKASLRTWRRMVLSRYEESQEESNAEGSPEENMDDEVIPLSIESVSSDPMIIDDQGEEPTVLFNEDLLCEHKNMIFDENQRKLITAAAWELFKQYFSDAADFPRSTIPCELCQVQIAEDKQTKDEHKMLALEQKTTLQDLYLDKNRPNISKLESGTILYAISQGFLDEWKKFVRDSSRRQPVTHLCNTALLCPHGKLEQMLSFPQDAECSSSVVLIWESEWLMAKKLFKVDQEIEIIFLREDNGILNLSSAPDVCESCSLSRLQAEERLRLEYSNAKIFVRRVIKANEAQVVQQTSTPCITTISDSEDEDDPAQKIKKRRTEDSSGPAAVQSLTPSTVVPDGSTPSSAQTPATTESWTTPQTCGTAPPPLATVRRSNRRRPQRGEKAFTVSSDQTLKDLKVQIMKAFGVVTIDQQLSLEGRQLTDGQATLASLGVSPGALLLLKVDEIGEEVTEDYSKATAPETGFKGTGLLD